MTVFKPSLPPVSSSTTRMRSGRCSTLVPSSACAVSAAEVRLRNSGSPAPTPIPYRPRARNSRREHPHVISLLLSKLVLRHAQHEIQQLAQRGLQRLTRLNLSAVQLVSQ